jgi:fermentation-respiration switch protein FrsA (DUF1100 family)
MKRWMMFGLLSVSLVRAQEAPKELTNLLEALKKDEGGRMSMIAQSVLGKDGGNQLFYFPTHDEPCTPQRYGLDYEDVAFRTTDGIKLHAWFLPVAEGRRAKGTIVFSHGNSGSLGYYMGLVDWLVQAGYQLIMYDYRGFGKSEGFPTREGLVKDVEAAFAYTATRQDVDKRKIISFSHSLGGAASIVALCRKPVPGLCGVVTDGTFASYQGMAVILAGNLGKKLVTDELAPKDVVAKLPAPLLMIHGTADTVVPIAQGQQLFAAANARKTFFEVKGGRHHDSLARNGGEYRKKVLEWLGTCLSHPERL